MDTFPKILSVIVHFFKEKGNRTFSSYIWQGQPIGQSGCDTDLTGFFLVIEEFNLETIPCKLY